MTPTIMTVYGTRPEAIKLAPVITALHADPRFETVTVVTGQHRDMLDAINAAFEITPAHDLDVFEPGAALTTLAAKTLTGLGPVLRRVRPDAVVVQGDTTSALAAGLAAFYERIPVVHVEAGLRTTSIAAPYPEEGNRRLLSAITALHLAPTPAAADNLRRGGVAASDIVVTGNTVIDALQLTLARRPAPVDPAVADVLADPRRVVLVTAHRRESWGAPLAAVAEAIRRLADTHTDTVFVLPVHANPAVADVFRLALADTANVRLTDPLTYTDLCLVLQRSTLVITDSGGLQEEAPALGIPVIVLRDETERPEAVDAGTALLVGTDTERIVAAANQLLSDADAYAAMAQAINPFGDGRAAERTVAALAAMFDLGERIADFSPGGHVPTGSALSRKERDD